MPCTRKQAFQPCKKTMRLILARVHIANLSTAQPRSLEQIYSSTSRCWLIEHSHYDLMCMHCHLCSSFGNISVLSTFGLLFSHESWERKDATDGGKVTPFSSERNVYLLWLCFLAGGISTVKKAFSRILFTTLL